MRTNRSNPSRIGSFPLGCALVLLGGCATGDLTRTFGLTRDPPDEYTVTTRAPLSMPPDYNLRPPRPGAPRPQEQSERDQAAAALVPQLALGSPQGDASPGQAALLQETGPAAPPDIRAKVDQEANQAKGDEGFINNLLVLAQTGDAECSGGSTEGVAALEGEFGAWRQGRTSATRRSSSRRKKAGSPTCFPGSNGRARCRQAICGRNSHTRAAGPARSWDTKRRRMATAAFVRFSAISARIQKG